MSILIKNGTVVNEDGMHKEDVLISDGIIVYEFIQTMKTQRENISAQSARTSMLRRTVELLMQLIG